MAAENDGEGTTAAELRAWLVQRVAEEHGCAPEEVPVTEPLADLGLSSIDLLTLTGDLAGRLGCTVPGDLFWNVRTIAEVADRYGAGAGTGTGTGTGAGTGPGTDRGEPLLVALQPDGAEEPLYLVHSVAGEVVCWQDLAGCFARERPVFALQQPEAAADVEALAEHYVESLVAHRPAGRFCIAGHCYGARVAFDVARRLEAAGREVAFLGIVDGLPGPRPRVTLPSLLRQLPRVLGNLPAWLRDNLTESSPRTVARRLGRGAVGTWKALVRFLRSVPEPGIRAHFADASIPAQYAERYNANLESWSRYVPREYRGRLTLFRSRSREAYHLLLDDDGGWSSFARAGVEIRTVPGDHDDMIFAPHADALARELREAIELAA